MFLKETRPRIGYFSCAFALLLAIALVGGSCNNPNTSSGANAASGYVVYKLHWRGLESESLLGSLIPSELKLYFSQPNIRMEMSSLGGIGRATCLLNTTNGDGHVMVAIVGVRSHYHEVIAQDGEAFFFNGAKTHSVSVAPVDTMYMERKCKRIASYLDREPNTTYRLIYCPELGWESMNRFSPFQGIEGMVLRGTLIMGRLQVELEAQEIVLCDLSPQLFRVEENYKEVSRSAMEQLLGFGRR